MLDVCLLGTGGMMPLPNRYLTSLMCRYNGSNLLIDCGEGTQVAIRSKGLGFKSIDTICFTHFHGDHISGLPGLLLTMGNSDRTNTLTLIGPKGLNNVVSSLLIISPELPFKIKCIEINDNEQDIEINGYIIHAFKVKHKVTCYGYVINVPRLGKFDVDKARELGIPINYWNSLQHGESVEYNNETLTPDMVMGKPRKGLKITYCTDTRPTESIVNNAMDSDLLICEGMYGEEDKISKAKEYMHMTFNEAAAIGNKANVEELWLTHYSPSLVNPKEFEKEVRTIFERTKIPRDGWTKELKFRD